MYGHHEFDLYEAIYTTRSMRRLKPDPVEPGLIVKVIEAATMGPSGHNRQPWFFIVVRETEAKAFVAERYRKAWEVVFTPTEREVVANDPQSQRGRNLRSAKYLAEHIADVPVMIFACVKKYTDRARAGQPMWVRFTRRSRICAWRRAVTGWARRSPECIRCSPKRSTRCLECRPSTPTCC